MKPLFKAALKISAEALRVFKIKIFGFFLLLMIGTVLASQYQSCTSLGKVAREPAALSAATGDFLILGSSSLTVSDMTMDFMLNGSCSKNVDQGAEIEWALYESPSPHQVLEQGRGHCKDGKFSAHVVGLEKMDCQKPYALKASFRNSGSLFETQVEIVKSCPPLSRQVAAVSEENQKCFFEKRVFSAVGEQCVQSCYQAGLIKSQRMVQKEDCGPESGPTVTTE